MELVRKYPNTKNLIKIDEINDGYVLKGYLLSKKFRILILFQYTKGKIVPITIVKKESKEGYNITKENYIQYFENDISKVLLDVINGNVMEIDISGIS